MAFLGLGFALSGVATAATLGVTYASHGPYSNPAEQKQVYIPPPPPLPAVVYTPPPPPPYPINSPSTPMITYTHYCPALHGPNLIHKEIGPIGKW